MSEPLPAGRSARSYALLLPPGWVRLPVRSGSGEAVNALLDERFADLPRDKATPFRRELQRSIEEQLTAAREAGGLDFYLPVGTVRGRPAAASFVVSHLPLERIDIDAPVGAQATTAVLAEIVGADPSHAQPADVAGAPGIRIDRVVEPDPTRQSVAGAVLDRSTRRIDYVVAVPGDGGWLIVSFSTAVLHDDDKPTPPDATGPRFDDLLVELFDAIVTTIRWRPL